MICDPYGWDSVDVYRRLLGEQRGIGDLQLTDPQPATGFQEPLTATDAAGYLRIDEGDEPLLPIWVAAARQQAELMQHRQLVQKQFDLLLPNWPGGPIELATPLQTVDLVAYTPSQAGPVVPVTLDPGTYCVDRTRSPARLLPSYGYYWPQFESWPGGQVLVRFTAGYAPTSPFWQLGQGPLIKAGMLMLVSAWYENRLPFAVGQSAIAEYPFAITNCFSGGARPMVF